MKNYTFTIINPNTKKGQSIISAYKASWRTTLQQAYPSHYSHEKARAFANCIAIMEACGGHDMRITGKNTSTFSCACYGKNQEGQDGLIYFTASGMYFIPLKPEITPEEFEKRWRKVSPNIKEHTANALKGRTITSIEEAKTILELAEGFTLMEKLFQR